LLVARSGDKSARVVPVRNFLGVVAGFVLTAALLYGVVPHRPNLVDERREMALVAREYCEILFVGPSYVFAGVEPDVFDAEARRIGLNVRSCKFGVSGLKGYDLKLNIESLLEHDWPRLELIVIDITLGEGVAFAEENWFKPRVLEWHTVGSIPWLLAYYADDGRSWREKGPLVLAHLEHVAAHYTRLGGGQELLEDVKLFERLAGPKRRKPRDSQASDANEVFREDEKTRITGAEFEYRIRTLRKKKAERMKSRRLSSGEWPLELRELVRSHHREAYFLFAPVLYTRTPPKNALHGRDKLVVLDFNDPDRFPDLYREEVRGSSHHLNEKGGLVYSALLAREFRKLEKHR